MMNILTFDIEDWWVYDRYSIGKKQDYLPRLDRYLDEILALLEENNIEATFFCLGEVADKFPQVIKKIAQKSHHIGCHSYSHHFFGNSNPDFVAQDTRKALDVIENVIGEKVTAYRAPAFSITPNNKWMLGILAENGIQHDCSIFPAKRSFGGFPGFEQSIPAIIEYQGNQIHEFTMSLTSVLGKDLAYTGGGYFRLFPYWKIRSLVKKNDYVMTYFHIKDFDKKQVRKYASFQGEAAFLRYIKRYYGLNGNFTKFKKFINEFKFISVQQAANQINWNEVPVIKV